jgi:broad specificity phosphatase PhoE
MDMLKPVAYFVRHGSTELNDAGKFRGPVDVSLDDKGKEQAEELGNFFKSRKFSAAYHSSKKRTLQTIEPILEKSKSKIKPKMVKDFDAFNVGELSGKPKDKENLATIRYYQDNPDKKIPGGERLNDFRKRTDPKIMMVIHKGESSKYPSIAVIHSSIIHELSQLLHGDHNKVKVAPGGVVGIYKDDQDPSGYKAIALTKEIKHSEDMVS